MSVMRHSFAFLLLLLAGCSEPKVSSYEAPKDGWGVEWTAPAGWPSQPGDGMRRATYAAGEAELTVISLPGEAGGALANVNRWRGQLGLSPTKAVGGKELKTPLGPAMLVEFENKGKRTAVAFLMVEDESWFFKLTGPSRSVTKAKPGLLSMMGSLRRG